MKTRALGFLLMVAAAGFYAVGCGSSGGGGGTGGAGGGATGGKGMGGMGTAGAGMGGMATGMGGKMDAGSDTKTDAPMDAGAPTFTEVFAIISDKSTATSPGCTTCHDGVNPADGGVGTGLPHGMNFTTKAAAYAALVGVDSLRCPGGADAGGDASTAALKRVLASNAAQSVLVQKLQQGMTGATGMNSGICDTAANSLGMPINIPKANDGGATDGGDAGFTLTTYKVTPAQLTTIEGWINAGALND